MNRPKTILIAAITADGYIAKNSEDKINWTSPEDKKHFAKITTKAGVVIMGSKTHKAIGSPLPNRLNIIYTRSQNHAENSHKLFTTDKKPADLLMELYEKGFNEAAIIGGKQIYDLFLSADLVDEIYLTVTANTFGSGISLTSVPTKMQIIESQALGNNEILLHYKIIA